MPRVYEVAGVLSVMAVATGCYPLMAHPTRVENGANLAMTVGGQVVRMKTDTSSQLGWIPNLGVQLVVGSRDSLRTDAISTRFAFGPSMSGFGWGAYAEFPETFLGETDAGFGVSGQYGGVFRTLTPYFQFGRRTGVNSAWLVSQGLSWVDPGDSLGWTPILATTLGLYLDRGTSSGVAFVTLLAGNRSYEYRCSLCVSKGAIGRTSILFGVSRGFRLGRPEFGPGIPARRQH